MTMNMYIVMNMNIYISPQNEERLRNEASMSGLINKLLSEHYGQETVSTPVQIKTATVENKPEKIVGPVQKSVPPQFAPKLCKNGHPIPYPRDKCLGKGCSYS